MEKDTLIGLGASICTGLSLLPQLLKIFKEKKPAEISYPMLIILFAGLALWIWYGSEKKDLIIIISNAFSLLINLNIFIFDYKYRKKKRRKFYDY